MVGSGWDILCRTIFLGVSMAVFKGIKVKLGDPKHTHRIHGAAIYGNMDPINIPPLF